MPTTLEDSQFLTWELQQAGLGDVLTGVTVGAAPPGTVTLSFAGATPAQQDQAAAVVAAHAWTQAAFDAWVVQQAKALVSGDPAAPYRVDRAVVLVSMDEVNALRGWLTSFKAAVAASATLADLKTRVAALPALPDRTAAQAKAAVVARLDTADAG